MKEKSDFGFMQAGGPRLAKAPAFVELKARLRPCTEPHFPLYNSQVFVLCKRRRLLLTRRSVDATPSMRTYLGNK
jgi:hypothetical protein